MTVQHPTAPLVIAIRQTSSSARRVSGSPSGPVSVPHSDATIGTGSVMVMVVVMVGREDSATRLAGDLDDRAAVGGLEDLEVEDAIRLAKGDLAAVSGRGRVESARLFEVVGGDDHAPAAGGELGDQLLEALGAVAVEAAERSSSSSRPASWTSPRATSTRWRCPPESSPNVSPASSCRPTAPRASSAARRSERPGRRHQGRRESDPISATSSAETG